MSEEWRDVHRQVIEEFRADDGVVGRRAIPVPVLTRSAD
jgi:hypothetical protein